MPLVTVEDTITLLKINNFPRYFAKAIATLFLKITRLSAANTFYDKNKHQECLPYLTSLLDFYKIKYHVSSTDLEKIPKDGAFITVSNHPLGGADGIILLKTVLEQRPDYKIIANYLLQKQEPVAPYILPVNPFEENVSRASSIGGLMASLKHLKDGKPLGIFPAGEVSTLKRGAIYEDKQWELSAIKLIKKANVPVIPIYFHAKNSRLFYFLSKINPLLRTLKLSSELGNKENQIICIKIGNPIETKRIAAIEDINQLNLFLRKNTYELAQSFDKKNRLNQA
jgi:putative hemolysin